MDVLPVAHYRSSDIEPPVSPVFGGASPTIDDDPLPVSPGFVSPPTSPLAPPPDPPPRYRTLSRSNAVPDEWPSRWCLRVTELILVPQPTENRFSWEVDMISGREEGDSL